MYCYIMTSQNNMTSETSSNPGSTGKILDSILSGTLSETALRTAFLDLVSQPITPELMRECVQILRGKMIPAIISAEAIDTCGTGGSGLKTINTSTLTAFIVAAAGGKVAKHGNRSASGNCGCFDLLEYLGVRISLTAEEESRIFEKLGIVFLFAPNHHPALRFVGPLRKEYGKKTIFNLIGPLCNPAGVKKQMIGTGNKEQAEIIANSLLQLGSYGSMVVSGEDGLDEISITAPSNVYIIRTHGIDHTIFHPDTIGINITAPEKIEGGSVEENASIFRELASGKGKIEHQHLVIANAAHALYLSGLVKSIGEGAELARTLLQTGKVLDCFNAYANATQID